MNNSALKALVSVVPHPPQRTNVFDDALAAATAVSDEWPRVKN